MIPDHSNIEASIASAPQRLSALDYATLRTIRRNPPTVSECAALAVTAACYVLAGYAQHLMPGGFNWSPQWELANFLMNIAAGSSLAICIVGCISNHRIGWRRSSALAVVLTVVAGLLPLLMLFFASRWGQNNFA